MNSEQLTIINLRTTAFLYVYSYRVFIKYFGFFKEFLKVCHLSRAKKFTSQ